MTPPEWALVVAGAATAGFVQGLSGFGFGLTSMSFWAWGLMPQQAAVLATVGGLIGQCLAALRVRRGARWQVLWPYLAGGIAGLPLGLALLGRVDANGLRLGIGLLLVVWCPVMLMAPRLPKIALGHRVLDRAADALAGIGGGVLAPLGGFTGVVPTLWSTLRGLPRDEQRAVIQNFNLTMLAVTTALLVERGWLTRADLPAIGVAAVALVLPALVGMRVYARIDAEAFRRIVLTLLTASGAAMLLSVVAR